MVLGGDVDDRSSMEKCLEPALYYSIPARPIVESPAPMNFAASCISIFYCCVLIVALVYSSLGTS